MAVTILFSIMAILSPLIQDVWMDFVGKHGDGLYSRVFFPWMLSTAFYWAYGLLLLIVDFKHTPTVFYQRKFQPKAVMIPDGSNYMPPLKKCLLQVLFNQIFVILPGLLILDWYDLFFFF